MDDRTFTAEDREPTSYEPPTVTDYGNLTDITAGQSAGNFTDRSFPVNTPARDLTFS
jgi:hypothetical protein